MDKEKELITECLKNQTKLIKEQTKVLTNLAIKNQLLKNEIEILKTRVKNSEKIIFYLNRTVLIILIILLLKV
ncbi:hypothetical protein CTN00_03165 [Fusobacterium pseudoperiodonticum]|uniref:hypothetical protein n=1 Tax=Fusobacterium pseudoperiodonticum TaxID=2663009 RepID=UPI000C1C4D83|nr:hypothetical protein [Fusobacterium pseudoperiodonticum]ATV72066.1 hypothetical protein CTN00_03165 [Fusobacterium pseudoperiodonticum]MBF1200711.1 hypothetical protein [Fusobacterium periodonticum]